MQLTAARDLAKPTPNPTVISFVKTALAAFNKIALADSLMALLEQL